MLVQWLETELRPATIAAMGASLLHHDFSRGSTSGFRIERSTARTIVGRYIERAEWTEKVKDPGGRTIEIPRLAFQEARFVFGTRAPSLEVSSSSRAIRSLLARIDSLGLLDSAVSHIEIDPSLWARSLRKLVRNLSVVRAVSRRFEASLTASAQVTVEGTRDVEKELMRLCGERGYSVQELRVEWLASARISCVLRNNGTARLTGTTDERAVEIVRRALREAMDT